MWRYLIPVGLLAALLAFFFVGLGRDKETLPSPLIGKPAPDFELTRLDAPDQKLRRDEMLGKVWVLNVWASWCAPCREEHPLVVDFARRKLAPVYGLNYKDTRPAGMAFLTQLGNPYEASLFDADGRIGIDYGVYGVPETFVIDKQGIIRYKHIGPLTLEVLDKKIAPLVKELNV